MYSAASAAERMSGSLTTSHSGTPARLRSTSEPAPKLGADFQAAADVAGLTPEEVQTCRKSGAFDPTHQLKQFITTSVLRFRQKGLFRKER